MEPLFKVNGLFPAYSVFQEGFALETVPDNVAYILDSKGWKLFKKNGISLSLISVNEVEGLTELKESIHLTVPRIPLALIKKVTAFFAAVYKKHKSEAVGYLYYNPTSKEWDFVPPAQTATAASAKYDEAPVKAGWKVAGTIHSHGSMGAFHSGTDKHDEEFFDGIHITVGKLDGLPEYSCTLAVQKARRKYEDPNGLIEGMADGSEIPETWMNAIKEEAPDLIDDEKVGKAVAKLYTKYFSGEISEDEYEEKLAKLEDKADKPIIDTTSPSWSAGSFIRRYRGFGD